MVLKQKHYGQNACMPRLKAKARDTQNFLVSQVWNVIYRCLKKGEEFNVSKQL